MRLLERKLTWGWLALGLVAIGGASTAAVAYRQATSELLHVRVGNGATETRMVLELDQPAMARVVVEDPKGVGQKHLSVVLSHARTSSDQSGRAVGLLRQWRSSPGADSAKLDLDFDRPSVVKRRFLLPPDDGVKVYRYVIDFGPADGAVTPNLEPSAGQTAPRAPQPDDAPSALATQKLNAAAARFAARNQVSSRKVIVIDAGHGGKDPGASGTEDREKDVSLAAARALRDRLMATGRYQVVLTRTDDTFIPLEQRVQIARRENADLFISLHADSIQDPNLHGATVYTLSDKGVDRVARKVISHSDWFINVDLPGRDPSVNRILLDLTQRETTNQSSGFANILLDRLSGRVDLLRRSHRDANYMVLLAPDVPAVLLEMGFISNPLDEQRLSSPEARKKLADAVAESIDAYFSRQTRIALR